MSSLVLSASVPRKGYGCRIGEQHFFLCPNCTSYPTLHTHVIQNENTHGQIPKSFPLEEVAMIKNLKNAYVLMEMIYNHNGIDFGWALKDLAI